jgi:hypothetical protein
MSFIVYCLSTLKIDPLEIHFITIEKFMLMITAAGLTPQSG